MRAPREGTEERIITRTIRGVMETVSPLWLDLSSVLDVLYMHGGISMYDEVICILVSVTSSWSLWRMLLEWSRFPSPLLMVYVPELL